MSTAPVVIILAGPNGAGKTTAAPVLLRGTLGVTEFVNADDIARGLPAFSNLERAAMAAGRVMLARLHQLASRHVSFAFETTLASRSFAPWLKRLKERGYTIHIFFLWLPRPELAIKRVQDRVRMGDITSQPRRFIDAMRPGSETSFRSTSPSPPHGRYLTPAIYRCMSSPNG